MPTAKNRTSSGRKSSEFFPNGVPKSGSPDSYDDASSAEPKRTPTGQRTKKTLDAGSGRSGPDQYDGRKHLGHVEEADQNGKWNRLGKTRPAVVISRDSIRKPGGR